MILMQHVILSLVVISTTGYTVPFIKTRRNFISTASFLGGTAVFNPPQAPAADLLIKVTPIAHTFIVSKSSAVKPIRENDSTRILTNARVVLFFLGSTCESTSLLPNEIVDLTVKRKREKGAGVTPGNVKLVIQEKKNGHIFFDEKSNSGLDVYRTSLDFLPQLIASNVIGEGDCLLIDPLPSGGAREDEKVVKEYASKLELDVGGEKSGGIVGVLLNGPRAPNALDVGEGGSYTLLWYDV